MKVRKSKVVALSKLVRNFHPRLSLINIYKKTSFPFDISYLIVNVDLVYEQNLFIFPPVSDAMSIKFFPHFSQNSFILVENCVLEVFGVRYHHHQRRAEETEI